MRLKQLANLSTSLLITACLALGGTLWWSQQALEKPYLLMQRYLNLSQQFQQQVADHIQAYLASGDALRHSQATQALAELEQQLGQLPDELADTLRPSLEGLAHFASGDLLAAGKLAGDPQGLLLQAEREMAGTLDQLARYADDSGTLQDQAYAPVLFRAAQHLTRLAHARDKLASSGRGELAADVERELGADEIRRELHNEGILEKERKMLKDTTDKANQMFSDKPLQNLLKDSSPTKDSSAADKEQSS